MNIIEQARQAYAPGASPLRSGRSVEHQLFSETTARLSQASNNRQRDFPAFVEAVHANRAVWLHLASQVAEDENNLPKELRARLFYLAEFTTAHSRKVLSGTAEIQPLIDINTAVMRGLTAQDAV